MAEMFVEEADTVTIGITGDLIIEGARVGGMGWRLGIGTMILLRVMPMLDGRVIGGGIRRGLRLRGGGRFREGGVCVLFRLIVGPFPCLIWLLAKVELEIAPFPFAHLISEKGDAVGSCVPA